MVARVNLQPQLSGGFTFASYYFWFLAVLDPALLRPGRFDLVIDVPTPNKKGRKEILQHYFEKVKHNSSVNVERLASITGGLNGSQLENIVNQAAIRAVRQRHEQVDTRLVRSKIKNRENIEVRLLQ